MTVTLTATEHDVLTKTIERSAKVLSNVEAPEALDAHALGLDLNHGTSYPSQSLRFLKSLHSHTNAPQQGITRARLPLKIVIVGAGLGGLATAIALARKGHSVVVLEQSAQLGEVSQVAHLPSLFQYADLSLRSAPGFKFPQTRLLFLHVGEYSSTWNQKPFVRIVLISDGGRMELPSATLIWAISSRISAHRTMSVTERISTARYILGRLSSAWRYG